MAESLLARVTAITHRGRVRSGNEDAIVVNDWVQQESMVAPRFSVLEVERPQLCAVCDGMGGHAGGEIASLFVATSVAADAELLTSVEAIAGRLVTLSEQLFDRMESSTRGMGTTVAGLLLHRQSVFFFNVGDSRVYRLQNGYLRQLSVDDTASLVDEPYFGHCRETGQRSSRITQALGGADERIEIAPHVGVEALWPASRYLICSDGLTDMVDLDTMEMCLREADDLTVVSRLLGKALDNGGEDNISVIVVST